MKNLIFLISLIAIFTSCKGTDDPDAETEVIAENVSAADISTELPELSIYHLPATWDNQDGEQVEMQDFRGKVLVMVMIYTSCQAACPRLVADMRNIEKQIAPDDLDKIKFILVSIDPETDTPERLKQFSKDNLMEDDQWVFLRGTPESTREFAAVLAVNYKQISPIDFSHSNIISVFDENGVLIHQQEGLGVNNKKTLFAIAEEISN